VGLGSRKRVRVLLSGGQWDRENPTDLFNAPGFLALGRFFFERAETNQLRTGWRQKPW
jgi:hypothetical protein